MCHMASALYRMMMAFYIDKKIKPLKHCLNNEQTRYNHRIVPLLHFEQALQTYSKYKQCYDSFAKNNAAARLYVDSCHYFELAKNIFENIKENSFQEEVNLFI